MVTTSNRNVVNFASAGKDAQGYGAMSTDHYRPGFTRYGAPYVGSLPSKLARILNERFREGAISQVVYSYSTPIAWKDGDVWIRPDVSYSVTTSKHQSYLYPLQALSVPWDASEEEYLRVVGGLMAYQRSYLKGNPGRYYAV